MQKDIVVDGTIQEVCGHKMVQCSSPAIKLGLRRDTKIYNANINQGFAMPPNVYLVS